MKDRKTPFRTVRISEEILAIFEDRKRRDRVPGPFNTYVEAEVSRLVRQQPAIESLRQELRDLKSLLLGLMKESPIEVKAFREPGGKHGEREAI